MSRENIQECCGNCEFVKPLTWEELRAVIPVSAGLRDRPYTHYCGRSGSGLLVAAEDQPATTRFRGKPFPGLNDGASCYSLTEAYSNLVT